MNEGPKKDGRRPASFTVAAEEKASSVPGVRAPRHFDAPVTLTPDADDPFIETTAAGDALAPSPEAAPRPRRLTAGKIAAAAFGLLFSMAFGLWLDGLVRDLFAREDWLGYAALGLIAVGAAALAALALRELVGLGRLAAVQHLKEEARQAALSSSPAPARKVVARLVDLVAARPQTARGRARLAETKDEIIDAPHLLELAERELLAPLDRQARALILASAKRVSIVTAVSPRALVDLGYVVYESSRLIRAMAELYGGRPGKIGLLRLMRDVIAHLAVTGSIAVGDSLVQQVLGHGLASKLSARLGEGVINGLMTARIGIAAMDLCRPLPFVAVKRPGVGDFLADLTPAAFRSRTPDGA
ncbi:TIGR01620 family protein [Rhizobium sp. TRM95111]|uniref:YcjF family protein n=1 Tax=Rhizobium alarense TaxID=2846851 RepID=UPI001F440F44|nr:TIGR01620 family protein [Rhizobium alarense]MCF3642412.1 TIGR01620 family protein [Rhizobium alarense]